MRVTSLTSSMAERFINAAKDGYMDLLKEATKRDLNTPDEDGITATMWAAHNGNLEALRLIVGRQGDVNMCDYMGFTALHHATHRGHFDVVSYLIHWGCNLYALDNDLQSALDLAAMHNRTDIVKFLDQVIAQRQTKNPKQASRQKEEAMRAAEANIKRYEKLQLAANKKAEKEHKRKEQQVQKQLNESIAESKPKKSIFQSITLRMKGKDNLHNKLNNPHGNHYSDMAGLTTHSRGKSGIDRKLQMKQLDSMTSHHANFEGQGHTSARSNRQTLSGSSADVVYVTGEQRDTKDDMSATRRPMVQDIFGNRAKGQSDMLDNSDEEYNQAEDQEGSMFNRPGFAKIAFLQKPGMVNTMQSFEDPDNKADSPDFKRRSGDGEEKAEEYYDSYAQNNQTLPWNPDDLGNLDDENDEDHEEDEFSSVEMFVCASGLPGYLHIFSKEKIDMELLMTMTNAEFRELGLPFGPMKKLRAAIDRRKSVIESPPTLISTQL